MHILLQPLVMLVLYALIRAGDIAIAAAKANDVIRAIVYGLLAILLLITLIVTLLTIH